jgi:uncharacterized membrane protein
MTVPIENPERAPLDPHHASENLGVSGHRHRELTPEEMEEMEEKIRKIEIAISYVLRIGVSVSVIVLGVGLGLMFSHHSAYGTITGAFSYHSLTSRHTIFPHSFGALGTSLAKGQGRGIVVLGVLLLILTPILRVAVGVLSFIYEKDPPMTIVTLYVLGVLIASFFLAGA